MIGVIIATHSNLAHELLHTAEMILGPPQLVAPVSIDRDVSVELARQQMQQEFERVNRDGDGVIILTDLFGGTPTNISVDFLVAGQVEILTGVNLPMLLKCINTRGGMRVDELAGMLKEYARNAILRPSELLGS